MNQKISAKTAGWGLILMAVVAGFAFGYAYPIFYTPDKLDSIVNTLTQNIGLYQYMLIGMIVVAILDLIVSYVLYMFFKEQNPKISSVSAILRIIYTIILGFAISYLARNIYTIELTNNGTLHNMELFQYTWNVGLIVFGAHLCGIGYLMLRKTHIPHILAYITLVAGLGYIVLHILKTTTPDYTELISMANAVLVLPMTLGEIGLALWLVIKGGK